MAHCPAPLLLLLLALVALAATPARAQSNSILDRVRERASTQGEQRTNQEVDEAVDKTVDCVFNPVECARRKQAATPAPGGAAGAAPGSGAAEWYAENQGERVGPMPQQELVSKVVSGQVTESTLVWREGMSAWTPAGQVAELGDAFKKVPPPLPPQRSGPPPLPAQR